MTFDGDSQYVNSRLAKLYDLDSGWSKERDFYLDLAGGAPKAVLDLGCGTGLLCNAFAGRGHSVTGVDPAPAMLEIARQKPNSSKVSWVQSTVQIFETEKLFDLIIMTGNAFQVLQEEGDLKAAFNVIHKCLKPDGLFAFETRNPNLSWDSRWNYQTTLKSSDGEVIESRRFLKWNGPRMSFELNYHFQDEILTSESTLRFWSHQEIETHLVDAGLFLERLMGDWDYGEFMLESTEEMVFFVRHNSAGEKT